MNLRTILIIGVLLAILGIVFLIDRARQDDVSDLSNIITSIIAENQTQGQDAVATEARSQDFIVYTLTAENPTKRAVEGYEFEVNIADITELATLVDATGANYNSDKNSLTWAPLSVPANDKADKQFTVRVKDDLPADSDLVMTAQFNNEVKVKVSNDRIAGEGINIEQKDQTPFVAPTVGLPATISLFFAGLATLAFSLVRIKV
ncbi:MAG: hypothetical protein HYW51_01730 [Candidatus Doudnabacteria bacterium]|nr:hypothetical protein [Candidatus Doudnabacteria bacterium]